MTEVKCKVKSCYYWGNGNICEADTITVDNNTVSGSRMEAGDLNIDTGLPEVRGSMGRVSDFELADLNPDIRDRHGSHKTQHDTSGTPGVLAQTSHETLCCTFRPKHGDKHR